MPSSNQINPFNYNIDDFDSGFLGPITDTNFRNFLFTHNLGSADPTITNALGGNAWQDRGTEYNVSQSTFSVVDVPNVQDAAQIPSVYNNLTNPRQVNLTNNLQNLNPDVQNILGFNTPIQAGLGQDVSANFNPTISNLDLPGVQDAAQISSDINNFTLPRYDNLAKNPTPLELLTWYPVEFAAIYNQYSGDYDTSYGVPQALKIGFAGNVEEWVNPAGIVTTTNEIRDERLFAAENKWGPNQMLSYSYGADEVVNSNTGLIQYSTAVQGDFRDQLLSRSLGVGVIPFSTIGSGINFKPDGQNISELDKIARKRRGDEVKQRIKLNFVDNTIGALNTSPFSLLSGGNLIQQNYTITVPKSGLGKAAQFVADLAGFNLPTSIIPYGAFGKYGVEGVTNGTEIDISNDILDYTGSGQKSLLYNALYINKYGPTLESAANPPTTKLGKIIKEKLGAGQAPNTQNYLSYQPDTAPENTGTRKNSLIDNINQKIKSVLGKSNENAENLRSTVFEDTSDVTSQGSDQYGGFYGKYEPYESVGRSFSEKNGFGQEEGIFEIYDYNKPKTTYNGTPVELYSSTDQKGTVDEGIDWRKRTRNPFSKGILSYTQQLVNDSKLRSATGYIGYFDSEGKEGALVNGAHQTGVSDPTSKPTNPSKGNVTRNLSVNNKKIEGGDLYCRSWSSRRKYHSGNDLIRNDGNWWKVNPKYANLMTLNWGEEPTGHPKIAWDSYDNIQWRKEHPDPSTLDSKTRGLLIPYMFSIENLAWKDAPQKVYLPPCELGPNGGRIMWFPPYDIEFSDNTSVNWDKTDFIGRGEAIYTYNNTERTGSLSWKIVVDHPEVLNNIRNEFIKNATDGGDGIIHSFFAGCDADTISKMFKTVVPDPLPEPKPIPIEKPKPVKPKDPPIKEIKLFFENCRNSQSPYQSPDGIGRAVNFTYEVTQACIGGDWAGKSICSGATGLNVGVEDKIKELAKFLVTEDGKNYKIKVFGYTSPSSPAEGFNKKLALDRATNTAKYLYDLMVTAENGNPPKLGGTNLTYPSEKSLFDISGNNERWNVTSKANVNQVDSTCPDTTPKCKDKITGELNCCDGNPCKKLADAQANSKVAKETRFSLITLEYQPSFQTALLEQQYKIIQKDAAKKDKEALDAYEKEKQERIKKIAANYINECDYFMALKKNDPFIYKSIGEKIQNFHPAFHAITPEGFNSRLTFLQQCTRQGPQMLNEDQPQNMVFGRPPICVLRIGDFYHTKIVIDSMNFSFDPLQWDLNPEGIGVQPMVVKVDMGFKFIGGSSLGGPIKQLQNAVSYNFFANTGVYNQAVKVSADKLADLRGTYIYGAFLTPEQANELYAPPKEEVKLPTENDQSVTTEVEKIEVAPKEEEKKKVEVDANKNLTSTKPAQNTPPKNNVTAGQIVINADGSITTTNINTTVKKGTPFEVKYNVLNKTKAPVIITAVNVDCESFNFTNAPIKPNGLGTITYTTRKSQMDGFYQRSMTVDLLLSEDGDDKHEKVTTTLKPE